MAVDSSANIGIRIFLDDAASKGLYAINSTLGQIGTQARMAGQSFKQAGDSMVGLGVVTGLAASFALFGGALAYSVNSAIALQTNLVKLALATGLPQAAILVLRNYLMDLGSRSIFSIDALVKGMILLGQYGFKTVPAMEALTTAGTQLAEAMGVQPVDAMKLLGSTMQAFVMPASQANLAANLLFYSFEHGTPNLSQLQSGFAQVAGTADVLGVHLADLIPAFDILSPMMGGASQVGTSLRYALNALLSPTSKQADEQTALGLSFADSTGHFIGFQAAVMELHDKMKGMSPAAQLQALTALFTVRGANAMKDLLSQYDLYLQAVAKLKASQDGANGIQSGANRILQTSAGLWAALKTNITDIAALIGTNLLPVLGPVLQELLSLSTVVRQFVSGPAGMAVAIFLALGTAISALGIFVAIAISPFAALIGIIFVVVGAVVALSMGILWLIQHWQQVIAVFLGALPTIRTVALVLLGIGAVIAGMVLAPLVVGLLQAAAAMLYLGIVGAIHAIPTLIGIAEYFVQTAAKAVLYAITNFTTVVPSIWATVVAWVASRLAMMAALLPYILIAVVIAAAIVGLVLLLQHLGFLNVMLAIAKQAWAAILPTLIQVGNQIKGAFLQALTSLQPVWQQLVTAFTQARPVFLLLGAVLGVILVVALAVLVGIVRMAIVVIGTLLVAVIRIVAGIIQAIAGLLQFWMGFFRLLQGLFSGNTKIMSEGWTMMMNGLKNIATGIGSAILAAFTGLWHAIIGGVQAFVAGMLGVFKGLWNSLVGHSIVWDIVNGTVAAFLSLPPRVMGILFGWIGSMLSTMGGWVGRMIGAINLPRLVALFASLPGLLMSVLSWLPGALFTFGSHIIQMFISGIQSAMGGLLAQLGNIAGTIASYLHFSGTPEIGPLHEADTWMPHMMTMFATTAKAHLPTIHSMSSGIASGIAATGNGFTPTTSSASSTGGRPTAQFIITLDGKVIYNNVMTRMRNGLQAQGTARLLR